MSFLNLFWNSGEDSKASENSTSSEMSQAEIDAILASNLPASETSTTPTETEPAASAPLETSALSVCSVPLTRTFTEIYEDFQVPTSPMTAERVLKIMESLDGQGLVVVRAAIMGLEAGDDSWTISDPVNDAEIKIRAIGYEKDRIQTGLSETVSALEEQAAQVANQLSQNEETIKNNIREMQELLAQTQAEARIRQDEINQKIKSSKKEAQEAGKILVAEAGRLGLVPSMFQDTNNNETQ